MRFLLSLVILCVGLSNLNAQPQPQPKDEKLASLFAWRDATNKRLENIEKTPKGSDNSAMISAMQAQIAQLNQQIFSMQQLQIQQLQQQLNKPSPGGPAIPLNPNPGPVIPLNPNPGPVIPLNPNPGPVIPLNPNPGPTIPLNPNPGPVIPGPGWLPSPSPGQPQILPGPVPLNPNPGPGIPGPGGSGFQRFTVQPPRIRLEVDGPPVITIRQN